MDLHKLNPWNWFKHEEAPGNKSVTVPVKHGDKTQSQQSVNYLSQIHQDINQLFEKLSSGQGFGAWNGFSDENFSPLFRAEVNIASDKQQYSITLEAPGLSQKDISIELQDRVLVIKGSKQHEEEDKNKHFYRIERRYGSFQRILAIPDDADANQIKARMDKGVLTIIIPRHESSKKNVQQIKIDS
ncbi:MAG: Hsp20/alpha crystallin family protein [Gammaproteobacteria bacterium]|nr:Hsp20/alpha crystallin family protein [Gammaproteobacteria bacterium]MDH5728461.1 Hsp20/alpha crystallin family protein [Gammaproteobacteria bacterium]